MKKENKGITLVALAITIIILLILAGITLNLTIGQNGIFRKAQYAKEQYQNAQENERKELNNLYSSMLIATNDSSQITISIEDLNKLIDERIKNLSVPTGTVISYLGNNVPTGYLSCDGKEYNITDYPNLAEQIKTEFGNYNYYGGDGVTTFTVPDLRGEFLRGTGTATRNTGSGNDVGTHQDPTKHLWWYVGSSGIGVYGEVGKSEKVKNADGLGATSKSNRSVSSTSNTSETFNSYYTSRPTNTSVLYCIKY